MSNPIQATKVSVENPTRSDSGTTYWRSLEQLADPASETNRQEFADGASEPPVLDDVSRRNFLGIAAATAAVAGLTSCRKPVTRILPFAKRPEDLVPGTPKYYATAHIRGGLGTGILVKSSDGRPTKVEGNPLHPSSLGGTDHLMQAELLNLYDPARSKHPVDHAAPKHEDDGHGHAPHKDAAIADFMKFWAKAKPADGNGLRILMEPTSSPSTQRALANLQKKLRGTIVHTWAPVHGNAAVAATTQVFGHALDTQYDLTKADVVVSVDCDFQGQDGNNVRNARDYASRRRISSETEVDKLSRLYAMESYHSLTGSNADHRFRLRPSEIGDAVMALALELKTKHGLSVAGDYSAYAADSVPAYHGKEWITKLAKDLAANKGKCALVIGPRLPVDIQVVLHALNVALGNVGKAVTYTAIPVGLIGDCGKSITDLAAAMGQGAVKALVILGGNPVYNAPAELDFAAKLAKVPAVVHLSQFMDETSSHSACTWHVNQAHDLEAWGDILGHDGTATLVQPLIAPLYDGVSNLEMIALLADNLGKTKIKQRRGPIEVEVEIDRTGYDLVRETWKARASGSFDTFWNRALHDGMVPGTKAATVNARVNATAVEAAANQRQRGKAGSLANLEVQFRPSYNIFDGRYTNNSWLMELPDAMTKICWDNAALMSLATMTEAGLESGDQVDLTLGGKTVRAPVWPLPGHADHTVTLTLGYGRTLGEEFHAANGAHGEASGYNAYSVRGVASHDNASGLKMSKKVGWYKIAVTQEHGSLEGRDLVRENDVAGYKADPGFAPSLNPLAQMEKVKYEIAAKKHDHNNDGKPDHPPEEHGYKPFQDPERPHSMWKDEDLPDDFKDPKTGVPYSTGNQWGMVIDLNTCTGCNACVSACVSENNISMVGKEQITKGREMFWNRIDRYFGSDEEINVKSEGVVPKFNVVPAAENPRVVHQMVPCMQCENASCEVVCPVAATTHSPEGLNDMAYNRCIGTRYCGNNCPYKVRRFNYLDFKGDVPEQIKMTNNPDVTVRTRGVMEKCTYCVQRINRGKIDAKKDGRRLPRDGEIQTACEQACPTQAITFGNIIEKDSRVAKLKASNLNYAMLAELNMRPRTTYLAKIRNPNPELVK
jgi:molybdopterin-containing oxidoreductase family iron-sulfur binding subunit